MADQNVPKRMSSLDLSGGSVFADLAKDSEKQQEIALSAQPSFPPVVSKKWVYTVILDSENTVPVTSDEESPKEALADAADADGTFYDFPEGTFRRESVIALVAGIEAEDDDEDEDEEDGE